MRRRWFAAGFLRMWPWSRFFSAVAIRTFQELKPPPDPAEVVPILAPRAGESPVQMVLVIMEGENVQTALLPGDPTQPVMARHIAAAPEVKPFGQIEGQTTAAQGNIIFAATPYDSPDDVGSIICFCEGRVMRLTSAEEFSPIVQAAPGEPDSSPWWVTLYKLESSSPRCVREWVGRLPVRPYRKNRSRESRVEKSRSRAVEESRKSVCQAVIHARRLTGTQKP